MNRLLNDKLKQFTKKEHFWYSKKFWTVIQLYTHQYFYEKWLTAYTRNSKSIDMLIIEFYSEKKYNIKQV